MNPAQFLAQFGAIANAPEGIQRLREMILQLAVQGKLVAQEASDEPAAVLLEKIQAEKERLIREGTIKRQKPLPAMTEAEKPFALPEGWEWVRLNEVYDVRDGTHDSPKYQSTGYPLVTSKNLYTGKLDLTDVKLISEIDHQQISLRSKVDKNDILFAMIGSIGNPVIVDIDIEFSIKNVALFKYYSLHLANPRYLLLILKVAAAHFKAISSGGVQSFVALNMLRNYVFALAPLSEQNRIMQKVDSLLSLCDQLEALQTQRAQLQTTTNQALLEQLSNAPSPLDLQQAWQRLQTHLPKLFTQPEHIKGLRDAILQLAVQGKLVPQDANDEPAAVLLAKIKAEKERLVQAGKIKRQKPLPAITEEEKPFTLPKGWEWVRLGDFTLVGTGSTPSRENPAYYNPPEINWVSSGETGQDFISATKEKISKKALLETNVSVYPIGSLILAMYGQGKTRGQVSELLIEAGTNQACAAIQFIEKHEAHRKYIKLFFKKAYEELRSQAAGGAQPNLNVAKVSTSVIPLPPLTEKIRLVSKTESLLNLCDQLESHLKSARHTQEQFARAAVALE
ncbi:MAG: restriction endonuclease subunit S [Thiolinea sp.]